MEHFQIKKVSILEGSTCGQEDRKAL